MNEINKEDIFLYAELEAQRKAIEERQSVLKENIFKGMRDNMLDKIEVNGGGMFIITHRKTWTYSEVIKSAEEQLKKDKKVEEARGIATYEEKESLMYKSS